MIATPAAASARSRAPGLTVDRIDPVATRRVAAASSTSREAQTPPSADLQLSTSTTGRVFVSVGGQLLEPGCARTHAAVDDGSKLPRERLTRANAEQRLPSDCLGVMTVQLR